jgi:hypothetical protein
LFFRLIFSRPLRTSWLIVGIVLMLFRQQKRPVGLVGRG